MKDNTAHNSIGVTGLLLVAFIVLKLVKVIDWSWWWVLSPMWITIGLAIIMIVTIQIIDAIRLKKIYKRHRLNKHGNKDDKEIESDTKFKY